MTILWAFNHFPLIWILLYAKAQQLIVMSWQPDIFVPFLLSNCSTLTQIKLTGTELCLYEDKIKVSWMMHICHSTYVTQLMAPSKLRREGVGTEESVFKCGWCFCHKTYHHTPAAQAYCFVPSNASAACGGNKSSFVYWFLSHPLAVPFSVFSWRIWIHLGLGFLVYPSDKTIKAAHVSKYLYFPTKLLTLDS